MPFNLGIGGAMQAGFVYALENGYDLMVQVDADGQHDPGEISAARGDEADTRRRHGVRLALPGHDHRYPAPVSRRTGIHVFAFLSAASSGSG